MRRSCREHISTGGRKNKWRFMDELFFEIFELQPLSAVEILLSGQRLPFVAGLGTQEDPQASAHIRPQVSSPERFSPLSL
ncbi:hypothetical protein AVEN_212798-1 [Araneus ventricosus]|uniref:Uncharacterized protein n=1 Tax=Araneus ventricosus TaxID=182803 RepID=A0A4Y2KZE6_ARAVE|nr:hypothetical protein AVEN_212798-1 [Araneus ventricosus]